MLKKLILIDDVDMNASLDEIKNIINEEGNFDFQIETEWFNPVDRKYLNEKNELNIEESLKDLEIKYLNDSVDVIGCDFNLDRNNKTLMFDIIEKIRTRNKICNIFVYSGGINKAVLKIFNEEGDSKGERLLRIALSSNISEFINGRGDPIRDKCIELLKNPNLVQHLEKLFVEFEYMKFYPEIDEEKATFLDVAKLLRENNIDKNIYCRDLILKGFEKIKMTNINFD
jgi:hypothetical protein